MRYQELFEKGPSKKTAATAWVILFTPTKVILGKRAPSVNNPNQWNFFGGHVDDGETPAQAAVRELLEETNFRIDPSALKQLAVIGNCTYFSAMVPDASSVHTTAEISKVKSFKVTDLPDNLHSKTAAFFDNIVSLLA